MLRLGFGSLHFHTSRVFIFVDVKQGILSVFASLSFNLLWVIHALIHTNRSVVSFKTERIWLALVDLYNCVSSAYIWKGME